MENSPIFLDTVIMDEIKEFAWIASGVTTTPTFFAREGVSYDNFISEFLNNFPDLELHIEAIGSTIEETKQAIDEVLEKTWFDKSKIVLKIPVGIENLKLVKEYSAISVRFNTHLIFTPQQAVLGALVNSAYVCPLMGRYADKISNDQSMNLHGGKDDIARELIEKVSTAVASIPHSNTKVMASSVRTKGDFHNALISGADVITTPIGILRDMFSHPMTEDGIETFLNDLNLLSK